MLCVSRYTRAAVVGWAAIAPERVVVVPNTVAEGFTPGDGSALRAALGLDGKRVLLTVGRMDSRERYKGHDRVIAAIPALVAAGPRCRLSDRRRRRRPRPPEELARKPASPSGSAFSAPSRRNSSPRPIAWPISS